MMRALRSFDAEGCRRRFADLEPVALQPGTHGAALATLLNFSLDRGTATPELAFSVLPLTLHFSNFAAVIFGEDSSQKRSIYRPFFLVLF